MESLAWSWGNGMRVPDEESVLPRIMSARHPEAVASLGGAACEWIEDRLGRPLRWWQVLVVWRALEIRADGSLCWPNVLLSTTRQVGKSYLLREVILYRMTHPEWFGDCEQTIVYTANHLDTSREVWRPAMLWAERQGWAVRKANGEQAITHPENDSRWLVRATGSAGFGFTINMPVVDECWSTDGTVVDDQLAPTMVEVPLHQMWLVSTAHPAATQLFPVLRRQAMAQQADPDDTLIVEWSCLPGRESDDPQGWAEASPFWNERRRAFVRKRWEKVTDERSFRCQWLNEWPQSSVLGLCDEQTWASLTDPSLSVPATGTLWLALEAVPGGGGTVVTGWMDDAGNVCLTAEHRLPMLRALTRVTEAASTHPGSTLLLGASLDKMIDRAQFPGNVLLAGTRETRQATHLFQGLAAEGRVRHDGDATLAAQVTNAVVAVTDQGAVMSGTRSPVPTDAARASLWVTWAAHTAASNVPAIY
jgi:hypothetical protein